MIDGRELMGVLRNRFEFSEALDREGFHREAAEVRATILCVMASDQFDETTGRPHERYAIRGGLSWEDVGKNVATNAAGGALMGAMAGGGIGAIPGAVGGAAYGLISQPMGALWYRGVQGATAKASGQAGDMVDNASKLAKILNSIGAPQQAQMIQQIAAELQTKVQQVRDQRFDELSEQYGLNGSDAGLWDRFKTNITHPLSWLGRTWKMTRSEDGRTDMVRTAQRAYGTDMPVDVAAYTRVTLPMARALGRTGSLAGGFRGFAFPAVGYMVGSGVTGWGWDKAANAIRGQMGTAKKLADEIGRQAAEISSVLQDPSYIQYAQQIAQVLGTVDMGMAQKMASGFDEHAAKSSWLQQQQQQQQQQQGYGYGQGSQQPAYQQNQQAYYAQPYGRGYEQADYR